MAFEWSPANGHPGLSVIGPSLQWANHVPHLLKGTRAVLLFFFFHVLGGFCLSVLPVFPVAGTAGGRDCMLRLGYGGKRAEGKEIQRAASS